MTQLENVIQLFDKYARIPLSRSAKDEPLILVQDDHNVNTIVAKMRELYGESWSLQRIVDLVQDLNFAKQLHWQIQPGYQAPLEPVAPPTPRAKVDGRDRFNKLVDAGMTPQTHKASVADQQAEKQRHDAARDELKGLFSGDPKRTAFDDELRSANQIQITTSPGIISRVKSYAAREEARKQIRLKYPKYAHLAAQPESENLNHRPGVF
jgi:hypothetical protein